MLFIAFVIAVNLRGHQRSREHLGTWAERQDVRLTDARFRWAPSGAFLFRRSRAQRLYNVSVVDKDGRRREGVAKVGGWFTGSFSDQVDVKWRDE